MRLMIEQQDDVSKYKVKNIWEDKRGDIGCTRDGKRSGSLLREDDGTF